MIMKKLILPLVILSSLLATSTALSDESEEAIAYAACKEPQAVVEVWKARLMPPLSFENLSNCAKVCGKWIKTCEQSVRHATMCLRNVNKAAGAQARADCSGIDTRGSKKACTAEVKALSGEVGAGINAKGTSAKAACRDYQQACIDRCETPAVTYEIGDTGPGGGTVFYLNEDGSGGLEAAPEDQESSTWCDVRTDIATIENLLDITNTDNNSGAANTDAIIAACSSSAAGVARAYAWPEGQTDGFLPNREELGLLFDQIFVVSGFANALYWSSSENSNSYAWFQNFHGGGLGGGQGVDDKNNAFRVRAVRAFTH